MCMRFVSGGSHPNHPVQYDPVSDQGSLRNLIHTLLGRIDWTHLRYKIVPPHKTFHDLSTRKTCWFGHMETQIHQKRNLWNEFSILSTILTIGSKVRRGQKQRNLRYKSCWQSVVISDPKISFGTIANAVFQWCCFTLLTTSTTVDFNVLEKLLWNLLVGWLVQEYWQGFITDSKKDSGGVSVAVATSNILNEAAADHCTHEAQNSRVHGRMTRRSSHNSVPTSPSCASNTKVERCYTSNSILDCSLIGTLASRMWLLLLWFF